MSLELIKHLSLLQAKFRFYRKIVESFDVSGMKQQTLTGFEKYDSVAMRNFVGIDLGVEGAPDETTVCKFRHLLERAKLGKVLLN
jgi:hypothetical protein